MKVWVATSLAVLALSQGASSPQLVVDELLAADRAFAAAAADTTAAPALLAMFADDVVMRVSTPTPGFARGKQQAAEALAAAPGEAQGRLAWTPIRGGISADGRHGFTFGYMTLIRGDGGRVPMKYVAYWTKQPRGWRVAVYKRVASEQSPGTLAMMPPWLPQQIVEPITAAATIARHKASLEAAERAFAQDAQKIGLAAAFSRHGSPDAVNVGAPNSPTFVVGAAAIGEAVGAGMPTDSSPLTWAPDEGAIVASSGDLGVTFGFIRFHTPPPPGQPAAIPFITIWQRQTPVGPWRYIAE